MKNLGIALIMFGIFGLFGVVGGVENLAPDADAIEWAKLGATTLVCILFCRVGMIMVDE